MEKLTLEWRVLDGQHVALVFDIPSWRLLEHEAKERGMETTDMIAGGVAMLLGRAVRA